MPTIVNGIVQNRRETAATFTSGNPVLYAGEIAVETDTLKLKVGDGSTAWNSLTYLQGEPAPQNNYSFDISASSQTLDLSGIGPDIDGTIYKAKWTGGDGSFQLSIVIPTGYTIGGVAKATIEADLKGDGQGVLVLVKNGTDLEVEKFSDTDGGNWPVDSTYTRKTWKKYVDGTIEQTATEEFTEATDISSGSNFRITPLRAVQPYPLSIKAIDYSNISIKEDTIGVSWISHWVDAAQNQLVNWGSYTPTRGSSSSNEDWEIVKIAKGRWTAAQIEVS
jgi:hypothetical protein